jgi:tetratricopeptide (TPR) repeat protein
MEAMFTIIDQRPVSGVALAPRVRQRTVALPPRGAYATPLALIALLWLTIAVDAQPPKGPVVHAPPAQAPTWLPGYRVRWPVYVLGDLTKQTAQSVVVSVPTGGWLKPDAADLAVQTAGGQTLPLNVLSHDPAGQTLIQFKRNANDDWYWVYGVNAGAAPPPKLTPVPQEGLSLEVREWVGENLDSWPQVFEGLKKSPTVIGNALVADVTQNTNIGRPDLPRKYAASYRGFLEIKRDGVYRFFVNGDDACFLFIDGLKVFERPGSNAPLHNKFPIKDKNGLVELKPGIHPLEVHQIVGDNKNATAKCSLLWMPPPEKEAKEPMPPKLSLVPRTLFVQPLLGFVTALEEVNKAPTAMFVAGIDDCLSSGNSKIYLVRFEAQGNLKDTDALTWDFGDGMRSTGRSVTHVYFKTGGFPVTLQSPGGLAPFRRTVSVWAAPGNTSPFSLGKAVQLLAAEDWKKAPSQRITDMFEFLSVCEQAERWPLLDAVCQHLLTQENLDPKFRAQLISTRMEALANLGKATEGLKLVEPALKEFAKLPGLQISVQMTAASIYQDHLKEPNAASKLYRALLEEHKRVEHPNLRLAAVRWGDLLAEAGDLPEASRAYKMAATLGGEKFLSSFSADATTRGARLRIAEQTLRKGDVHQARQLLSEIELHFPEQKLEGPYRFLRAECDRRGGRYEEALRNYEVLVKLEQWAGYRDRSLHGIADCYYRMGKLDKALEWYGTVDKLFPKYYEMEKLADVRKVIAARAERLKQGKAEPFFAGLANGFEVYDKQTPWNELHYWSIVRSAGMTGPNVGVMDSRLQPQVHDRMYDRPIQNLNPDGNYWIELWYRETMGVPYAPALGWYVHWYGWVMDADPGKALQVQGMYQVVDRTYGQWRRIGWKAKAPLDPTGHLSFLMRGTYGVVEVDGISIRPVSDRQSDSLMSFLEGTDAP